MRGGRWRPAEAEQQEAPICTCPDVPGPSFEEDVILAYYCPTHGEYGGAATCPTCSASVEVEGLCHCREPICWACCSAGEHHWRENPWRKDDRMEADA